MHPSRNRLPHPLCPSRPSNRSQPRRWPAIVALAVMAALSAFGGPPAYGTTWQPFDDRPVDVVLPGEPPSFLATFDDRLWKLSEPGGEWVEISLPEPKPRQSGDTTLVPESTRVSHVWVAPRDRDHWYVTRTTKSIVERDGEPFTDVTGSELWLTRDGGDTWEPVGGRRAQTLVVDPSRPDLVYAGVADARRHPDPPNLVRIDIAAGESEILALPDGERTLAPGQSDLAVGPEGPGRVYLLHADGVYVSADRGASWVRTQLPAHGAGVAAHPLLPGVAVVASVEGDVLRTTDGGQTWSAVAPLPPSLKIDLVFDPLSGERVYAVSGGVPFASDDANATWQELTDGLPGGAEVYGLEVDPADPSRLFANLSGGGSWVLDRLFPAEPCVPDPTTLCLGPDGRFEVRVAWQDFEVDAGLGRAVPLAADTGAFWFFDEENLELVVKVLDGGPVNSFQWVFYGSLTDVPFTLAVTDTATGESIGYRNPERRFASRGDTAAFPEGGYGVIPPEGEVVEPVVSQVAPSLCLPSPTVLCLAGDRFRVEVAWADFTGGNGLGTAVPATDDTGLFWFFREGNLELAVKVLDGRPVNGHRWVFYGALTNVAFELTVTDTVTGRRLLYRNPSENMASRGDTTAFPAGN